ncbi:hypothetical protein CDAR_284491 [Caerostris darwini]|uniref:Uncharacterized protein n=1 Tax=Caerostris darwini TaxID=1538125 RepID=A0AAV4UJT3_9ARAC|nr:hypothetical protein CDAR_284491 [Caerostris darwini]
MLLLSLVDFECKIDKVISTHVFHQLYYQEEGFKHTFDLLKPGGEAGFLFAMKTGMYNTLQELISMPKWKDSYKKATPVNDGDPLRGILVPYRRVILTSTQQETSVSDHPTNGFVSSMKNTLLGACNTTSLAKTAKSFPMENKFKSLADENMITNEEHLPTPSPKLSPMIVRSRKNIKDILMLTEEKIKSLVSMKLSSDYLKCFLDTELQNHFIMTFLCEREINFFQITSKSSRSLKTVLK